jgi:hypothetical protein
LAASICAWVTAERVDMYDAAAEQL